MENLKITDKETGIAILILCAVGGLVFPSAAPWILLCLVLVGIWSWWKSERRDEKMNGNSVYLYKCGCGYYEIWEYGSYVSRVSQMQSDDVGG